MRKKKRRDKRWDWIKTWKPPPGRPIEVRGRQRIWLVYIDTITGPLESKRSQFPVGFVRRVRWRDAMKWAPIYFHLKPNQSPYVEAVKADAVRSVIKSQHRAVVHGHDASFTRHFVAAMSYKRPDLVGKRPPFPKRVLMNQPKDHDVSVAASELPLGDDFSPTASAHRLIERVLSENRK